MQPGSTWVLKDVRFKCGGVKVNNSGSGNKYRMHLVREKSQGGLWRIRFTRSKLCSCLLATT